MQPPPGAEAEPNPPWESAAAPFARRTLLVLWPAFLMAGVLEALVFAVVDPGSLHWFGGPALEWPAVAVYSVTFLIFWCAIAAAGTITQWLDRASCG